MIFLRSLALIGGIFLPVHREERNLKTVSKTSWNHDEAEPSIEVRIEKPIPDRLKSNALERTMIVRNYATENDIWARYSLPSAARRHVSNPPSQRQKRKDLRRLRHLNALRN